MWAGFQDKKVQRPANDFDSNLRSDLAETCVKVFFGYFYSIEKKSKIINIWEKFVAFASKLMKTELKH